VTLNGDIFVQRVADGELPCEETAAQINSLVREYSGTCCAGNEYFSSVLF
jgi:hypothetical protein